MLSAGGTSPAVAGLPLLEAARRGQSRGARRCLPRTAGAQRSSRAARDRGRRCRTRERPSTPARRAADSRLSHGPARSAAEARVPGGSAWGRSQSLILLSGPEPPARRRVALAPCTRRRPASAAADTWRRWCRCGRGGRSGRAGPGPADIRAGLAEAWGYGRGCADLFVPSERDGDHRRARPAHSLVGVSEECRWPAEVVGLPVVTAARIDPSELSSLEIDEAVRAALREGRSLYAVDAELVAELAPDVIVTQDLCAVCAVSSGELASACPVGAEVISLDPRTFGEVADSIRLLGGRLGVAERGDESRPHARHGRTGGRSGPGASAAASVLRRVVGAAVLRRSLAPRDGRARRRRGCSRSRRAPLPLDELGRGARARAGARGDRAVRLRCPASRLARRATHAAVPGSGRGRRRVLLPPGASPGRWRSSAGVPAPSRRSFRSWVAGRSSLTG